MRGLIRSAFAWAPITIGAALVAACSQDPLAPEPVETEVPEELAQSNNALPTGATDTAHIGSPMEQRVATLGLLNKRNNSSQDIELSPGQSQRIGDIVIRVQACERTAPWELQRETGAFVQVSVQDRGSDDFRQIFSGWLFKNSPSLNVVEHPIYDVWVKDCAMSFPGEE